MVVPMGGPIGGPAGGTIKNLVESCIINMTICYHFKFQYELFEISNFILSTAPIIVLVLPKSDNTTRNSPFIASPNFTETKL